MKEHRGLFNEQKYRKIRGKDVIFMQCPHCMRFFPENEIYFNGMSGACEECWNDIVTECDPVE